jgi:hypothetical protein
LAPAGLLTVGSALALLLALQPTPTLAQVAAAQKVVKRYTVVNTRILTNGLQFKVTTYRDGAKWAIYRTVGDEAPGIKWVMDGTRTVTVDNFPNLQEDAIIDEPEEWATQDFDLNHLMGQGKKFTMSRITEDGLALDKFVSHSKYPGLHGTETMDQTILADAQTHLPVRMEVFRNNHAWGDIWEYRYGPISSSIFNSEPPKNTPVFDLISERKQLESALLNGPVVLVGQLPDVGVLFPFEGSTTKSKVRIEGLNQTVQNAMRVEPVRLQVAGKPWRLIRFIGYPNDTVKLASIKGLQSTSITVDGKTYPSVPIIQVGNIGSLLRLVWPR